MKQLILNADDFGLTRGVNQAVLALHGTGVLTSTTLMARAGATEEAIRLAQESSSLAVGCHVVLVDGAPILPPEKIPSLIQPGTREFWPTLGTFVSRLLTGRIRPQEIEAEAVAQIALLRTQGLRLTHVDTHKHTHLFPAVLKPLLRAAKEAGISVVRNPFEASWSLRATRQASLLRSWQVAILRGFEPTFRSLVEEEGFRTTDGAIGVLATGEWGQEQLQAWMEAMPEGVWELVTHPAYVDKDLHSVRTRLKSSRETERRALFTLRNYAGIERIPFSALASKKRK